MKKSLGGYKMEQATWVLFGFVTFIILMLIGFYWLASYIDKEKRKQGLK